MSFGELPLFCRDEDIKHITHYLYEMSSPDSCLVFAAQTMEPSSPAVKKLVELYGQFGSTIYPRNIEAFDHLIKPWKTQRDGLDSITPVAWFE